MKTDKFLWETCSPAALVVLLLSELGREPNAIEKAMLDSFGLIREGVMEVEYCRKEFERALKCLPAVV